MSISLFGPRAGSGVAGAMPQRMSVPLRASVTLDNCSSEPIHLPGHIQPHGTLLVFDASTRLIAWAENASAMLCLPIVPSTNLDLEQIAPSIDIMELVLACRDSMESGEAAPMMIEATIGGKVFDCIAHAYLDQVLIEFEPRKFSADLIVSEVMRGQRNFDRLRRQKTVESLLQLAVEQLREMTGYDRVMAYRFRQDDSGEVVAESCLDSLVPYLGQRYPASDIPAQARRLYVLNTLRIIADINYLAVPVLADASAPPVDMSHSVLRSVSPVHIEYLQNMGVAASMSISILVNGRLWGMLACHHMSAKHVPYAIRTSCDVMAQVLAATAQGLEANAHAAMLDRAGMARNALLQALFEEDNLAAALAQHADDLLRVFGAGGIVLAQHGKLQTHGDIPSALASIIVSSLPQHSDAIIERVSREEWPESLRESLGKWVGLLGLSFNPAGNGWLLILRVEQIEEVRWGGKPEKTAVSGPLGMRLTPRGSFDAWVETTRGCSEPWDRISLDTATLMLAELHRFSLFRQVETDRVRALLLAMLGHDLRDPLHSIQMAAILIQKDGRQEHLGRRIHSSGARMQRLIGQVLDMSVLQGDVKMTLDIARVDLVALITDIVDESRIAHPAVIHELDLPTTCFVEGDVDRLAQVFTNLISNALHHGKNMRPVRIILKQKTASAVVSVQNESEAIGEVAAGLMFDPFKATSLNNFRNPGGMGIGLYIVREIMSAHSGSVRYHYEAPDVVFDVELPLDAGIT
jgi:chemotaxis family two-component system sensor kinase Cph1